MIDTISGQCACLGYLLANGTDEEKGALMHGLELHYPRGSFSEGQQRQFWKDIIDDVSDIPVHVLAMAIRLYRNDPDAKFYPRVGALRGLAEPYWESLRRGYADAQRLLAYVPPAPFVRITPEQAKAIRDEIENQR